MILLAIDETGNFETPKNNKLLMIGGVIYQGTDIDNERKRIKTFLENICKAKECNFPKDLHSNDENEKKVMEEIKQKLGVFLKEGTYDKEELDCGKREGKYYVLAYVKSSKGKNRFPKNSLLNDEFAGNLYLRMYADTMIRGLFHNPLITCQDECELNLPTRTAVVSGSKKDDFAQLGKGKLNEINTVFTKIGASEEDKNLVRNIYKKYEQTGSGTNEHYDVVNFEFVNAVLEREITYNGAYNIKFCSINPRSINYKYSNFEKMAFSYLADILCTTLRDNVKEKKAEKYIEEIRQNAVNLVGADKSLVFSYDAIDDDFAKVLEAYNRNDYYDALEIIYNVETNSSSKMKEYYKNTWFSFIESKIKEADSDEAYQLAALKLRNATRVKSIEQEKLLYIYKILDEIKIKNTNFENKVAEFELNDAAISIYNHIGDPIEAEKHYLECQKLESYSSIENMISIRNKMSVSYSDEYLFDKAYQFSQKNERLYRAIMKSQQKMSSNKDFNNAYAKILSQSGQTLAFMMDKRAERKFKTALSLYPDGSPDVDITRSYLLHYYIEMDEKEKYEKEALKYFGNERDLTKQFEYIMKAGIDKKKSGFNLSFALYVYVKAISKFYSNPLPKELDYICDDIEEAIKKTIGETIAISGHPWEIIYKHLALIQIKKKNKKLANHYASISKTVLETKEYALLNVIEYGLAEIAIEKNDVANKKKHITALCNSLKEKNQLTLSGNEKKQIKELSKMFTYMYH